MIIHCPNCKTRYNLTPAQIGPKGRKVRCVKCGHEWFQPPADQEEEEKPAPEQQVNQPEPKAEHQAQAAHRQPATPSYTPPLPPENPQTQVSVANDVAQSRQAMQRRMMAGVGATFGLLALLIGLVIFLQKPLVSAMPALQGVYNAVGMETEIKAETPTSTTGLVIGDVERSLAEDDGITVLIFTGTITNSMSVETPVTAPRVHLLDERGVEIDSFPALPQKKFLRPGEKTRWICRFFDPQLERISEYQILFPEK